MGRRAEAQKSANRWSWSRGSPMMAFRSDAELVEWLDLDRLPEEERQGRSRAPVARERTGLVPYSERETRR